jgi:DNA-binding MarR family transcriptional regulator
MEEKKVQAGAELVIFDKYQDKILVHTDTESLTSLLVYKNEQKRKYQLKKYNAILTSKYGEKTMVFQDILVKASIELKSEELRLLAFMLGVCEFENWIHLGQSEISKRMDIKIPHISRALKGLREKGYIEVIKKSGSNYYRINPEVAWKGSMEEWHKVIEFRNLPKGDN